MELETFHAAALLGVYAYPFSFGEHYRHTTLLTYQPGEAVEAYPQEIYHPACGFVWLMLGAGEGFVLKRHRFADVNYLI